jgi:hypothetical protein
MHQAENDNDSVTKVKVVAVGDNDGWRTRYASERNDPVILEWTSSTTSLERAPYDDVVCSQVARCIIVDLEFAENSELTKGGGVTSMTMYFPAVMLTSWPAVGRAPEGHEAGSDQNSGEPRGTSPGMGQPLGAHGKNLTLTHMAQERLTARNRSHGRSI